MRQTNLPNQLKEISIFWETISCDIKLYANLIQQNCIYADSKNYFIFTFIFIFQVSVKATSFLSFSQLQALFFKLFLKQGAFLESTSKNRHSFLRYCKIFGKILAKIYLILTLSNTLISVESPH